MLNNFPNWEKITKTAIKIEHSILTIVNFHSLWIRKIFMKIIHKNFTLYPQLTLLLIVSLLNFYRFWMPGHTCQNLLEIEKRNKMTNLKLLNKNGENLKLDFFSILQKNIFNLKIPEVKHFKKHSKTDKIGRKINKTIVHWVSELKFYKKFKQQG